MCERNIFFKATVLFLFMAFVLLGIFGGRERPCRAAPNFKSLPKHFLNQSQMGGFPNQNAALFRFYNQDGDPSAKLIDIHLFEFDPETGEPLPVDVASGQRAFATANWFMAIIDGCERQTLRKIVDFGEQEPPLQCQVFRDEEEDTEVLLERIASLPEECLEPTPITDACREYNETSLRYDFATSMPNARATQNSIDISFTLDGVALKASSFIKLVNYTFVGGNPEDVHICAEALHQAPLVAYESYGYVIPPQTGRCFVKSVGAPLPAMTAGTHEFDMRFFAPDVFDVIPDEDVVFDFDFPITIIQH